MYNIKNIKKEIKNENKIIKILIKFQIIFIFNLFSQNLAF